LVAGEDVGDVLPSRLMLRVGDTLELVNQDSVFHIYGPVSARAGETVRWLLPQVGEFTGLCTSNTERTVTLTVVA
jgi:plastocyanin